MLLVWRARSPSSSKRRPHERGHEETWEREHIWQCYCCSYSLFGVKHVFVFAAREKVFVVILRFALFAFLSFRSAFAFGLTFCISEKPHCLMLRHRHLFDLESVNHFGPLVADTRLFVVRPC
jgi:hypothetical protein